MSIELFAEVVRGIAVHNFDHALLPDIARAKGIAAASWFEAHEGWNTRIRTDPEVGAHFGRAYRAQ